MNDFIELLKKLSDENLKNDDIIKDIFNFISEELKISEETLNDKKENKKYEEEYKKISIENFFDLYNIIDNVDESDVDKALEIIYEIINNENVTPIEYNFDKEKNFKRDSQKYKLEDNKNVYIITISIIEDDNIKKDGLYLTVRKNYYHILKIDKISGTEKELIIEKYQKN